MSNIFEPIGEFKQLEDGEIGYGSDFMYNLNLIGEWQRMLELPENGFGVGAHGDLSAIFTPFHSAASNVLADASDYYTATEVEAALAEIAEYVGKKTAAGAANIVRCIGTDFHAADPTQCSIVVPADTATSAIIVHVKYKVVGIDGKLPLYIGAVDLSSGGTDPYFMIEHVHAPGVPTGTTCPGPFVLNATSYPALDLSIDNTISLGASLGTGVFSYFVMMVEVV